MCSFAYCCEVILMLETYLYEFIPESLFDGFPELKLIALICLLILTLGLVKYVLGALFNLLAG